ncbi:MAG: glycosyltransferase [Candidatus Atribacteria bacterium]|nr:MAG: glycosyltransferase [Candidatus Atribacteria bacterium]
MKVLFICSGNSSAGISTVVFNQGSSLEKEGVKIDYFTIIGKGWISYFRNIFLLVRHLKKNKYELYHAHYALSGFVAAISMWITNMKPRKKLIVSLMGSDVLGSRLIRIIERFFCRTLWARVITKSVAMKDLLLYPEAVVIPNGVDMNRYKPSGREQARSVIGYDGAAKLVVFVADPAREEKNYRLAKESVRRVGRNDVELLVVNRVKNESVPSYLNAADLLLSTSKWEGSANVIKEAMACNIPVVSTATGDVFELFENMDGCYICSFNPTDTAEKIGLALDFTHRTNGRKRLMDIGLDAESIARRIIIEYRMLMESR